MNPSPSPLRGFLIWAVGSEGSSRSSALLRMGLVFLMWSRYAGQLLFYKDMSFEGFLLSFSFFLASTLMLLGLWSRFSTAWTAVVLVFMYYYFGYEMGKEPWTHHHNYLLMAATCLTALTPCGKSYSLDRWFAVRKAERHKTPIPPERGNLWGLRLIALQLSLVYLWTAFDKMNWAFLSGERMEHYAMWYYLGSNYPQWPGFHSMMMILAWATVALEVALGIGLLFRSTRRYLVIPGLLLHIFFYVLLPVRTYSLTVILLYLAYFDADKVHQSIDKLSGIDERSPQC